MWKYFVIFILVMSVITFFLLAIFGGSVGALLGMQVWRHKTQHWSFRLGIPIILILQAAGLVWYFFFSK